jgi:hypothetical protein
MSRWMIPIALAFLTACAHTPPKPEPVAMTPGTEASSAGQKSGASSSASSSSTSTASGATEAAAKGTGTAAGGETMESVVSDSAAHPSSNPPMTEDEETKKVPDRFMLRAGGFAMSNIGTSASLSPGSSAVGGTINFNQTLGLDTSAFSGRVDAVYRFGEHGAMGFSWYSFNLKGSRAIDKTIDWNGQTYPINTQVDSFLDQDIYKLNYRYSLYHNDDIEFGVEAGFDVQHFDVGLSASGIGQSSSEALTAPLPVFGAFVNYHFTPRLLLGLEYEFFFLELDNASGSLQDLLLSLEYRVFKNVALGAAFNFYGLDAEYSSSSSTVTLQQDWNGLLLYASFYL